MKLLKPPKHGARVLLLDIETAPLHAHVWGLWENNVGLNQIEEDWHMLSWSAKWLEPGPYAKNDSQVMYLDQRGKADMHDEKRLLRRMAKLLKQADVVITQNGKHFDIPKLNAKFVEYKIKCIYRGKHIDTKQLAGRNFNLPSYKLEYMTETFNKKYRKLKHKEFPGHEMWVECLADNKRAWNCMMKYNKHDVLALEELYHVFAPWDNTVNWGVYEDLGINKCSCGSMDFKANGHDYTKKGKFKRYKCTKCGKPFKSSQNLFDKETKKKLLVPI